MIGAARNTHGRVEGQADTQIFKILERDEAENGSWPVDRVLLWNADASPSFAGSIAAAPAAYAGNLRISNLRDSDVIGPGDVVRAHVGSSSINLLYRRGAKANFLFLTERCNSLCLMCSQPPRDIDDSWRVAQLAETIALIDRDEPHIGFTGGEPTLLGERLSALLQLCRLKLPAAAFHVLTNGRAFQEAALATSLIDAGGSQTTWAIPLYSDVPEKHDEIVGAQGAFDETLRGLFQLAQLSANVEVRVVLHALTIPRLRQLGVFLYRRLPFVKHVALMGLEPMGFAKANRERLWIDPGSYQNELKDTLYYLHHRGVNVSIYNLPHCALRPDLRPFARQSISDWKNRFQNQCLDCAVQKECAGLFSSANGDWRFVAKPILAGAIEHELA